MWNINRHNGVVAVFHLQGSSWSRKRRQFVIHDSSPKPLNVLVHPLDIEGIANGIRGSADESQEPFRQQGGISQNGLNNGVPRQREAESSSVSQQQEFVMARKGCRELTLAKASDEGMRVTLEGEVMGSTFGCLFSKCLTDQ